MYFGVVTEDVLYFASEGVQIKITALLVCYVLSDFKINQTVLSLKLISFLKQLNLMGFC